MRSLTAVRGRCQLQSRLIRLVLALSLAVVLYTPSLAHPQSPTFTIIDYPGASNTEVQDINDKGVVLGGYVDAYGSERVFTYANGIFTAVPDGPFNSPTVEYSTFPMAIDNNGEVLAYQYGTFFLYANGAYSPISLNGTFTFDGKSEAGQLYSITGINDSGVVAGNLLSASGPFYGAPAIGSPGTTSASGIGNFNLIACSPADLLGVSGSAKHIK